MYFFILAKKIRLSENPIFLKNKHARVVLHFWSKCKKSSKKECVIPSLYTDFAFTNIFFLDYIIWSIYMTNPNQFLFWGHPFLQKSQEKNEIFTKKWAFFMIFQCFFNFTSNVIILAQATLDEIFLLKVTSYLSPKAIIVSSSGLGHHFWSSVPFGITELTDFIIKSFYSLKYPKKLCLDQGGIFCCLLI